MSEDKPKTHKYVDLTKGTPLNEHHPLPNPTIEYQYFPMPDVTLDPDDPQLILTRNKEAFLQRFGEVRFDPPPSVDTIEIVLPSDDPHEWW